MRELKMIIVPSQMETSVWGRNETRTVKLRATLPGQPEDDRALPRLLEALGCFLPVHAALVVPARAPSFATRLYPACFADVGGARYDLQVIGSDRCVRREWWGK